MGCRRVVSTTRTTSRGDSKNIAKRHSRSQKTGVLQQHSSKSAITGTGLRFRPGCSLLSFLFCSLSPTYYLRSVTVYEAQTPEHPAMSVRPNVAGLQDLPPKGGYPPIPMKRVMSGRGPSGMVIWGVAIAATLFGLNRVSLLRF